jgi:integrase
MTAFASRDTVTHRGIEERRDRDGRIRFRVRVRRHGHNLTATLPTLETALAWRAKALSAVDGIGEMPELPKPPEPHAEQVAPTTVEDASRRLARGMVDGTIRTRDGRPFKPSVIRKYEEALRCVVIPRIGEVPIETLTRGDVQRLVDEIAAERTAEHARKALTALRVALRVAERHDELTVNPCMGVRVPTSPEGEKAPRILTREQCAAIIKAAETDDARLARSFAAPLVALALATGLRLGELLALRYGPDGLDLDASFVRVRATLDRVRAADGEYARLAPKSRASRRDVPLATEEVARLKRHRLATGRPADGELVFAPEGEALSPVPAYRAFKRACRAALKLPKGTKASELPRFHDLRHAFASHALAAGLSAHAVATLLGHSDAGLVWRRYGHALPDELAGAGEMLATWRVATGR